MTQDQKLIFGEAAVLFAGSLASSMTAKKYGVITGAIAGTLTVYVLREVITASGILNPATTT